MSAFDDVLAANQLYRAQYDDRGLEGRAARGIAVVTCMDSRIEPLKMLGLSIGDAKIMRNAGGRVTDDVLRTLVLATHLLGVDRILVVEHTHCKMASATEAEVHAGILAGSGVDTRSMEFHLMDDQQATLARDVQKVRSSPYVPADTQVAGFLYDVTTGGLSEVC
ncbi:MAG: carbonic anhydrase [Pseudorhodobacter sp.]|nr:carbonic anhydrase [Frankiaceae bacterium]